MFLINLLLMIGYSSDSDNDTDKGKNRILLPGSTLNFSLESFRKAEDFMQKRQSEEMGKQLIAPFLERQRVQNEYFSRELNKSLAEKILDQLGGHREQRPSNSGALVFEKKGSDFYGVGSTGHINTIGVGKKLGDDGFIEGGVGTKGVQVTYKSDDEKSGQHRVTARDGSLFYDYLPSTDGGCAIA